jgi:hypothetical protein
MKKLYSKHCALHDLYWSKEPLLSVRFDERKKKQVKRQ